MIRVRRALLAALPIALLALVPAARHSAAAATPATVGPKAYYLSLGDSAALGFQPNLQLWRGFADDFYRDLKSHGVSHYINMGCGGETTGTMINGGCGGQFFLKYQYSGPQLTAALTFISQHPGEISPVTLDIGANDVIGQIDSSNCTISSSFTQTLATMDANLGIILSKLRTALNGTADFFMMNYWFPYQNECPALVPYAQTFNRHLAADAHKYGVPIADVFKAFGGPAAPNPSLCNDCWMCSRFHDIHATTLGYAIIARLFESMAGY